MKVWEYLKSHEVLSNQRFVAFLMNIIYTDFYAALIKVNDSKDC